MSKNKIETDKREEQILNGLEFSKEKYIGLILLEFKWKERDNLLYELVIKIGEYSTISEAHYCCQNAQVSHESPISNYLLVQVSNLENVISVFKVYSEQLTLSCLTPKMGTQPIFVGKDLDIINSEQYKIIELPHEMKKVDYAILDVLGEVVYPEQIEIANNYVYEEDDRGLMWYSFSICLEPLEDNFDY